MLRKVEQWMDPVPYRWMRLDTWKEMVQKGIYVVFQQWGVLFVILGFLLGRAVIVGELTPFALPFLAVLYHLRKDKLFLAGVALIAGAMSHAHGSPFTLLIGILFFMVIQKLLEKWNRGELSYAPLAVFGAALFSQLWMAFLTGWGGHALLMSVVEASLSLVLTLIFVQSIPLFTVRKRKQTLRNEELVCVVILLASVMTGTVGWMLMGLSVEHVLARYAILVFALAAGGAIGATVGVVMGIILSLANVEALTELSLLAFSGLLGGLLKEGRKIGVAVGLLVGTLLMGLYMGEQLLWATFNESLLAIALFFMTPPSVFTKISQFIPGTPEHAMVQQDYMKRLRDVTSVKVNQFSRLFQHLAQSFSAKSSLSGEEQTEQVDLFLSEVTKHSCQVCFKKELCWKQKYEDTYRLQKELFQHMEAKGEIKNPLLKEWSKHCVKSDAVLQLMEKEMQQYRTYLLYRKKLNESKRLVADQLSGVSQVMNNFAREIKKEAHTHDVQEEQILEALEDLGLVVHSVDIISLETGNVEIEVVHPAGQGREECIKIVAPLLSDMLGEHITAAPDTEVIQADGTSRITLISAKTFKLETGMAGAAKGGGLLSGDSSNTMEVGHGKYAIAIADGMGNGERAHGQSQETLSLLQQILQSGIDETVAIKSINSVLSLRSNEEIFSTLDLAMVDLQTAVTKFLKIGSTPSFIKRGSHCHSIAAHNLPIGILEEIEVDVVSEQLKAGDLLVMMTDGIYDAPRHIENKERWMRRLIAEIKTEEPQQVADLLLEKVIRFHDGKILDDMTVVVAKVERNVPKWSTISSTSVPKLRPSSNSSVSS